VVSAERFSLAAAVYGVLRDGDGDRVLLLRRAGSGYHDGELSLPASHLDGGEDALGGLVRELHEELAISVDRDACRLALVMHRSPETPGDHEYLDLFFTVSHWSGVPAIGEPDKCSELVWAASADCQPTQLTTSGLRWMPSRPARRLCCRTGGTSHNPITPGRGKACEKQFGNEDSPTEETG
jgi:8-oxo-dGTP diphosphatase